MKYCLIFVCFCLLFFFSPVPAFAVSVTIANSPSIITDEPFTLTASVSGASSGINYLRIDIFKDKSSPSYFGETFNNNDWYGGSTYTQYLPITIQGGSWSGTIQGRIGSTTSSQYDGAGTYKMRLRRYTSGGGSTASEANNSAVSVSIVLPTATTMPTEEDPTTVPTKYSTPTATKTPTATVVKVSNSPTVKPSPTKKVTAGSENKISSLAAMQSVLGTKAAEKKVTPRSKPTEKVLVKAIADQQLFSIIAIIAGGVLLIGCGILIFLKRRKGT